jgi:hypothetical protein
MMQAAVQELKQLQKHFALCESCFWSATVFGAGVQACPSCACENVSMIPLAGDEQYRLKMSGGLEMSFSRKRA